MSGVPIIQLEQVAHLPPEWGLGSIWNELLAGLVGGPFKQLPRIKVKKYPSLAYSGGLPPDAIRDYVEDGAVYSVYLYPKNMSIVKLDHTGPSESLDLHIVVRVGVMASRAAALSEDGSLDEHLDVQPMAYQCVGEWVQWGLRYWGQVGSMNLQFKKGSGGVASASAAVADVPLKVVLNLHDDILKNVKVLTVVGNGYPADTPHNTLPEVGVGPVPEPPTPF